MIRPYRESDARAVRGVVESAFREFGLWRDHRSGMADLDDSLAAFDLPRGCFLVAERGGRVVGCGGLKPGRDGLAEISRMYLQPAARGRGEGRELLRRLIAHARRRGFRTLFLVTSTRFERAIRFYARAGFRGVILDTDNCCNVRMDLRLR